MDNLLSIVSLPIIVTIVYIVMAIYKHIVNGHGEIWTRLIPLWAALLGIALGIYIFYKVPSLIMAENVLSALLIGLVSGLSAVGFNQIGQQIQKTANSEKTTEEITEKPAPDETVVAEERREE